MLYSRTSKKKTITKKLKKVVPKSIQTRVVRIVTKVKGCPYFFLSSVFGCLFARHALENFFHKPSCNDDKEVPMFVEKHFGVYF